MSKFNISITGLLIMTFAFGACHDELLDPIPESVLTTSNFYNTAKDMDLAVIGIYSKLQSNKQSAPSLLEVITDNVFLITTVHYTSPSEVEINDLSITPDNDIVASFWENAYNGIYRANSVLVNIDKPTNYTGSQKDQFIGEAKFMRALFYFDLVRLFGGVGKITSLLSIDESKNLLSASEGEIYDLIIDDLKDAISKLPPQSSIARGRAHKAAAVALLAKVYVFRKDWTNASTYLEQLFTEFNYSLLTDFNKVFKTEDNSEIIFAVKYIDGTNGQTVTNEYVPYTGIYGIVRSGWYYPPTWSLLKLYEDGDTRKAASITEMYKPFAASESDPYEWNPYVSKFLVPHTAGVGCGLDLPVLRLGDMILLYSEVLYELQQPDLALFQLNRIRERAFGNNAHNYTLSDIPDGNAFMDKLFLERRLELAFENERWFDIVRSGKLVGTMAQHETIFNDVTSTAIVVTLDPKPYMEKLPIPQRQIDQCNPGVLRQNDGYYGGN